MSELKSHQVERVISVQNLVRSFGAKKALDDVSLSIPKGCVFGLVGENGAGKTTLIKHLIGVLQANHGTVRVFGLDPTKHPVEVLSRLGYVSEERELPSWRSVGDLVSYTSAFYPSWDASYAQELIELFALDVKAKPKNLSRGKRARTCLMLALAYRPDLLVLDEPSSGLDPIVRKDILTAIIKTIADDGRTVLFSSHLLDEVERVADYIAILHAGHIIEVDELENLRERFAKFTLRFDGEDGKQTQTRSVLGSPGVSVGGGEWEFVSCVPSEQVHVTAAEVGASLVSLSRPSLDEIFTASVRQRAENSNSVAAPRKSIGGVQ